ncbi:MAG TPA: YlbF family regulator [Verrucomicrobiae bacterium]
MPTKIETKTNELCEAILEQLQSNGIRKRIDTFLGDSAARGQYETLMSKGQALQEKQHHGQPLDPAEISAFEKDRDALLKNPVASGFLDAQEEMHELESSVKKVVAKTIELGRIPSAEDLSEGSCGHGCGCHH